MKAERPPSRPDSRREGKPRRAQRPPHTGEVEAVTARRVRALELRKAGSTYRDIAAQLGTSLHTAWDDINAELLELRAQTKHEAQDLRELELQRCDAMTEGLWSDVKNGNAKAVSAAIRVSERRSRLLGLDAAVKTEHSGSIDLRSRDDLRDLKIIIDYLDDDDVRKVIAKYAELKREAERVEAEVEKILEPARQQYLARQQHFPSAGGRT